MIYVMSDIHGNYTSYKKAMDAIPLKPEDTLYILGDVLDRGNHSMEVLLDMMNRKNIIPLCGNHEVMAYGVLQDHILEEMQVEERNITEEELRLQQENWFLNGGQKTLRLFQALPLETKKNLLNYMGDFESYIQVQVNGQDYFLSHAGINHYDQNLDLEDYDVENFTFGRIDYSKEFFPDKIMVTGHTPTRLIHDRGDTIYRGNNHIAIDCGSIFGGKLAVLCLDTDEAWYF